MIGSAINAVFLIDWRFSKSTAGVADVIINGVEIYDSTLEAALSNTFQGKLDMINAFTGRNQGRRFRLF